VRLLLDTHLLLWASGPSERLPQIVARMLDDPENELIFSVASLWEITIKHRLGRGDFQVEPRVFRRELLDNGYEELPITSEHALGVGLLPPIHRDPFDRVLIAQAVAEGIILLTSDPVVARYPGPVRAV
jgi:PIN domain nuclease of toxin-antitoxin system